MGAGNVAIHLARAMRVSDKIELVQYYSRGLDNSSYFDPKIKHTDNLNNLEEADIYILALKDEVVEEFSKRLTHVKGLVVHTSGSLDLTALSSLSRSGVLYPIQTFTKERSFSLKTIPIGVECNNPEDIKLLKSMASILTDHSFELDSQARKRIHLAAVFANNFSNYMFTISKQLCDDNNLSFDLLKPIIKETAEKINYMSPEEAQTGPARRNDHMIMETQEAQLNSDLREIYRMISKSIQNKYNQQ